MSEKLDRFLGQLTQDETRSLAAAALWQLPDGIAIDAVIEWAQSNGMSDELIAQLED